MSPSLQPHIAPFSIAGRPIGPGQPPYVVAELSANHRQQIDVALRIVEAAADAGADAVKFQAYTPDTLTIDCQSPLFRIQGTIWDGRTLYDLYREASTPWDWLPRLKDAAQSRGLTWFSSVFDPGSVDFLESLDTPAYKIASFELVDLPLLEKVAATGKPIILSTGMATLEEIDEAVRSVRQARGCQLSLLHCVSAYPAPAAEMRLGAIGQLAERFGVPVGLSDHTLDPAVPPAAVALGACILEKHLTLARSEGGPDSAFSLEPEEFRQVVRAARTAWQEEERGHSPFVRSTLRPLAGNGGCPLSSEVHLGPGPSEMAGRRLRRSLFAVADIRAGESFAPANVRSIRPGDGLHPRYLGYVLTRAARSDVPRGTPLGWEHVG